MQTVVLRAAGMPAYNNAGVKTLLRKPLMHPEKTLTASWPSLFVVYDS